MYLFNSIKYIDHNKGMKSVDRRYYRTRDIHTHTHSKKVVHLRSTVSYKSGHKTVPNKVGNLLRKKPKKF
jgi:hypothetical protein